MKATYEVKVPVARYPKFPNRCAVCGKERPTSAVKLSTHAFEWWMVVLWWAEFLFKGSSFGIPACGPCATKFMRQYRLRFAVELVLILAAAAVAFYLVQGIPHAWRKWAAIGLALLMLVPLFLWQAIWPMAVQITSDRSTVEFQFTDPEYAEEFSASNTPQPATAPAVATGAPSDQAAENARLAALFDEGRLDAMITIVENRLKAIQPATPFHVIIGKDFLHQVGPAADWLAAFHGDCAKVFRPADVYVEMNRFDINFDSWELWACARMEVPRTSEEWDEETSRPFVLTGMEGIQKAMEEYREMELGEDSHGDIPQHLRDAQGDAFFLVMLHMQNLVKRAWRMCGERGHPVGAIRVSAGVHDESMVFTAQPDELAALASSGGRTAPPPKYVNRPEYQFKYPYTWRADVDDTHHDIGASGTIHMTIVGPGAAFVRLDVYDDEALASTDEHTAAIAKIHWEREGVIPPTDVKARARKLIQENSIARAVATRFERWGQYRGEGLRVSGRVDSTPVTFTIFAAKSGHWSLVVSEQWLDGDSSKCAAGFELIRSTFRFGPLGNRGGGT
ncbi:MAG: hypothetical protein ACE15C_08180 [Phycisphaerae bacterium]